MAARGGERGRPRLPAPEDGQRGAVPRSWNERMCSLCSCARRSGLGVSSGVEKRGGEEAAKRRRRGCRSPDHPRLALGARTEMASAVASTSTARTAAARVSRRRVNRRTARSSPSHAAAALADLYHLAPTFVPAHEAAALHLRVTEVLTPIAPEGARPRPSTFRDLVNLHRHLDLERVRLTAARTVTSSLQSVNLAVPANHDNHDALAFGADPTAAGAQLGHFDYRGSFYQAYSRAGEPPLAARLRQVIDALHGTTAGGRAGPDVVAENGEKAVRWARQLEQAQLAAREQRRRDDDESRAFQDAFDDEPRQPPA